MGSQQNPPRYPHRPIRSLESLSRVLGISVSTLEQVAARASELYRLAKPIKKPDGSIRRPFDALEPLKHIQRRIKRRILDRVVFPDYLTGSLRGKDARANARLHIGAAILVCEDISNFFPSTTQEVVNDIWKEFFCFSPEVTRLLAALTTKDGALPQGAVTSSHLANLAFWREEHVVYEDLRANGLSYSRYVDDIAFSSKAPLTSHEISQYIVRVYSMMLSNGYRPKRRKQEIQRSHGSMRVTKLVANRRVSIPSRERARVRASVKQLELLMEQGDTEAVRSNISSVMGRVTRLKLIHPIEGEGLRVRLNAIRQLLKAKAAPSLEAQ